MSKHAFCRWCWQKLSVPDYHDPLNDFACCEDTACADAEMLFQQLFSNKAILDREELEEIYNGGDE